MPTTRPVERFKPRINSQLLLERRDAEQARAGGKSRRVLGGRGAGRAPLEHRQRSQLGEIEVDDVVTTVIAVTPGKAPSHVADVVEVEVVQNDELRVARRDDVLLEKIGAEPVERAPWLRACARVDNR